MANITEYLAENAKYMDEASAARIEQMTNEQWCAVLEAIEYLGGNDPGIDCAVVTTHESLDDFDRARAEHWRERGSREERACNGFPALLFSNFQVARGRPRQVQIVIDAGDTRICLV